MVGRRWVLAVGLLAAVVQQGLPIVEFARAEADLEDIFLKTTKGRLQ